MGWPKAIVKVNTKWLDFLKGVILDLDTKSEEPHSRELLWIQMTLFLLLSIT